MRQRLFFLVSAAGLACVLALLPPQAQADIIITTGNTGSLSDENIVFNDPFLTLQGNISQGITNDTGSIIAFESTDVLVASGGQARIEALDGSFADLAIYLAPANPGTFLSLILNITASQDGTVEFSVLEPGGDVTNQLFSLSGSGQNFFTIEATLGQSISKVSLLASVGLTGIEPIDDVRQIRIGGLANDDGPFPPVERVPAPGTLTMFGAGLLGLTLFLGRRSRQPVC